MRAAGSRHDDVILIGLTCLGAALGVGACAADSKAAGGGGGKAGVGPDCSENVPLSDDTISDFESGSGAVLPAGGRNGAWYAYNDRGASCVEDPAQGAGSAPAAMLEAPRCGSTAAFRMRGMGCSVWGAGIGTDLAAPAPTDGGADAGSGAPAAKVAYDLGAFRAISFWGRIGAGTTSAVRFKIPMLADTKVADGGVCQLSETGTDKCSDDWGRVLALTTDWKLYTVPLVDSTIGLSTEGWGKKFPLDLGDVTAIQFQVAANTTFDVWIDDVNLLRQ
jgi:hypothetical protein